MANNYTRWYREGTVNVTNNSTIVTGKDTLWQSTGLKPGDMFSVDNMTEYEVDQVNSNTQLTLKTVYTGNTASNVKYRIIRNWTANSNADVAAQAAELLTDFAEYIDSDMKTLTGKSAYKAACDNGFVGTEAEWVDSLTAYGVAKKNGYKGTLAQWLETLTAYGVAVSNGYTGTKAQWLESLKAAGEWTQASTRLAALEGVNAGSRLATAEGKITSLESIFNTESYRNLMLDYTWPPNLFPNEITAEQLSWIDNGQLLQHFYKGFGWTIKNVTLEFPVLNEDQAGDTYHDDYPIIYNGPLYIIVQHVREKEAILSTTLDWGKWTKNGQNLAALSNNHFAFPYNYKDSNECGYAYSIYHTKVLPVVQAKLEELFGANRLKYMLLRVSSGYNTATRINTKIWLPSVSEVCGTDTFSKIQYTGGDMKNSVSNLKYLYPIHCLSYSFLFSEHSSLLTRDMPVESCPDYAKKFLSVNGQHVTASNATSTLHGDGHFIYIMAFFRLGAAS